MQTMRSWAPSPKPKIELKPREGALSDSRSGEHELNASDDDDEWSAPDSPDRPIRMRDARRSKEYAESVQGVTPVIYNPDLHGASWS